MDFATNISFHARRLKNKMVTRHIDTDTVSIVEYKDGLVYTFYKEGFRREYDTYEELLQKYNIQNTI